MVPRSSMNRLEPTEVQRRIELPCSLPMTKSAWRLPAKWQLRA